MKKVAQKLKHTLGNQSAQESASKIKSIADKVEETGKLSLGHSYEILAQIFGFKDWNTARPTLLQELIQQAKEEVKEIQKPEKRNGFSIEPISLYNLGVPEVGYYAWRWLDDNYDTIRVLEKVENEKEEARKVAYQRIIEQIDDKLDPEIKKTQKELSQAFAKENIDVDFGDSGEDLNLTQDGGKPVEKERLDEIAQNSLDNLAGFFLDKKTTLTDDSSTNEQQNVMYKIKVERIQEPTDRRMHRKTVHLATESEKTLEEATELIDKILGIGLIPSNFRWETDTYATYNYSSEYKISCKKWKY